MNTQNGSTNENNIYVVDSNGKIVDEDGKAIRKEPFEPQRVSLNLDVFGDLPKEFFDLDDKDKEDEEEPADNPDSVEDPTEETPDGETGELLSDPDGEPSEDIDGTDGEPKASVSGETDRESDDDVPTDEDILAGQSDSEPEQVPEREPEYRPYVRATKDHIHIAAGRNSGLARLLFQYGFACADYGNDAQMRDIYDSIHKAVAVLVEAPEDITADTRMLSYQVREGIAAGLDVLILCERMGGDFLSKFEGQPRVRIICAHAGRDVLHGVFVEFLCKYGKAWSRMNCRDDEIGELVAHAIDARLGYPASEHYLAERYATGNLLPKSESAAMLWYNSAREHKNPRASVSLGDCYFTGSICPQNKKKAFDLYCEVADQDYPAGLFKKGVCLLDGEGCEPDAELAFECFRRATELDRECAEAFYYLGKCYAEGRGVEASSTHAKAALRKSAGKEYIPAFIMLGNIFSDEDDDEYNPALAFEYFSRAASTGHHEGLYRKGMALSVGRGCEKDADAAFECFALGVEEKNDLCALALGMCYEFGVGCEIDYERAFECYKLSSGLGNAAATNNLGGCYLYGHGVPKNIETAMELFERASSEGDVNASARLGLIYEEGELAPKNLKSAFSYYTKAATANAVAAFRLGHFYRQGVATQKDLGAALAAFEHAAVLGHAEAMFCTACAYALGHGTEPDEWSAFKWFSAAAQKGHGQGFYEMGNCLFKGRGTAKNLAKALYCYEKAYELGASVAESALRIGICMLRGLGTRQSSTDALEWFKLSAAQGNPDAQYLCGECMLYGIGCIKDPEGATKYYVEAAKQDHVRAIMALGECCERGIGRRPSAAKAMQLYEKAAQLGFSEAYYRLGRLTLETRHDWSAARNLFFKAANQGCIAAIHTLGVIYDKGQGIPADNDKAAEKYMQVITEGTKKAKSPLFILPERETEMRDKQVAVVTDATFRLGMLRGRLAKSVEECGRAFECIASAAAMGSGEAQREIARIIDFGGELGTYFRADRAELCDPDDEAVADAMNRLGDNWYDGKMLLSRNERAAVKCFRIAAMMGHTDASYSLGWCLRHGVGVGVDDVEAAKWLKRAADKGNAYAAYSYGLCCEEGSGMEHPNLKEALSYYRRAAASGHSEAKKRYLRITKSK